MSDELDNILDNLYICDNSADSAEKIDESLSDAKQQIEQLIIKYYKLGAQDALVDVGTLSANEIAKRTKRLLKRSK